MDFSRLSGWAVPALCCVCREGCDPGVLVCPNCLWRLDDSGPVYGPSPPGVEVAAAVAPHEGIGRSLLSAYKFQGLFGLGELIARRMAEVAPAGSGIRDEREVIPVPAAWLRKRIRGFDTAEDLADRLARELGWARTAPAIERVGLGRQRGQGRAGRLGNPPNIRSRGGCRPAVLLVDDVITTGATLSACATALRRCGATRITAVAFTWRI